MHIHCDLLIHVVLMLLLLLLLLRESDLVGLKTEETSEIITPTLLTIVAIIRNRRE